MAARDGDGGGSAGPKPRLVIKKMVLENFKSYAGAQHVGPFHKVRQINGSRERRERGTGSSINSAASRYPRGGHGRCRADLPAPVVPAVAVDFGLPLRKYISSSVPCWVNGRGSRDPDPGGDSCQLGVTR
jgi:hypothetical protein